MKFDFLIFNNFVQLGENLYVVLELLRNYWESYIQIKCIKVVCTKA